VTHVDPKLILITLLVELGVAAAFSSSLARSKTFKNLLLTPHRTPRQTAWFVAMICAPLTLGVWVRVTVPNFLAADLSLEGRLVGLPIRRMSGRSLR
jgi:two-component system LytT family sensor kinase